ncbi:hypothetical protein CsSME_00033839 [Camellia sinensis var. sinensis]
MHNNELSGLPVKDLIREDGNWYESGNKILFPAPISELILGQPSPNVSDMDSLLWKGTPDGAFSVTSMYLSLQGTDAIEEDWNWLWKLRLPQKLKIFLWTVRHGKLLTNYMRVKRGLTNDSTCPSCSGIEDLNHLFRECYKAKDVWIKLFDKTWFFSLTRKPWADWLKCNSRNTKHFSGDISWYTIFTVALWKIWKNRNHVVFENKNTNTQESLKFIFEYSREINQAFLNLIILPRKTYRLIQWVLPIAGQIKMNIDGCRRVRGEGGFGGLLRDERGAWVCGFYGKMQMGTSLEAKLWALYKGLTVLLQKGINNVLIETDAAQVVQLMKDPIASNCPFKNLVEDAKILFNGCVCTIQHIWKQGNLCADALAKLGANQPEEMLVVNEPPAELRSYLLADLLGISRERA